MNSDPIVLVTGIVIVAVNGSFGPMGDKDHHRLKVFGTLLR